MALPPPALAGRLGAFAQATPRPLVLLDPAGALQWANPAFLRLVGLQGEVAPRPLAEVLPGLEPDSAAQLRGALVRGQGNLELSGAGPRGPYCLGLELWPTGEEGLVGLGADLSAQKAARAAELELTAELVDTVDRLRVVLDGTEHAVVATDASGRITFFNRGAEVMLGWERGALVDVATLDRFHLAEELAAHAAELTASTGRPVPPGPEALLHRARHGESETRDWTYQRLNGSRLTASVTVTSMRSAVGEVKGFLSVANDVTSARQAEAGWGRYVERLVKLSSQLPGALYQYQRLPDGRACFPWASEGLRAVYGVEPSAVVEDAGPVFERIDARDVGAVRASIERSHAQLTPWRHEYRVWRGAVQRWVQSDATPERQADGSVLWHGYSADITERKGFEAELVRAREEAVDASRVKSEFLANMSHEIRTPLNGILGMAQLLVESGAAAEQKELINALLVSGHTLLALTNDILDLSKVESGRLELERAAFSPRAILERVVKTVALRAEEKSLAVGVEVDAELPASVLGDATRVFQILVNLVSNAVKFTERGGVRVHLSRTSAGLLRFEVHDSGIGISARQLARLFTPFTQADGSITRRYGGTGLGLTISRRLAEAMGGRLVVTSEEGVGSCFAVELPLPPAATAAPAPPPRQGAPEPQPRLSVLVAEDNAINALVVRKLLERDGHEVVHVTTGAAAVQATAGRGFDLVLMDVQMPELDGLEATRRIRQREGAGEGRTPICALTANAMRGDLERCREAGMDDYLTKPVELKLLREKLVALARP